jgi:hypothetical protein
MIKNIFFTQKHFIYLNRTYKLFSEFGHPSPEYRPPLLSPRVILINNFNKSFWKAIISYVIQWGFNANKRVLFVNFVKYADIPDNTRINL